MFGFSRGAFTARFLARMIHAVGILSMGNEEMLSFAYELYQKYEQGTFQKKYKAEEPNTAAERKPLLDLDSLIARKEQEDVIVDDSAYRLRMFKNTFCRKDKKIINGEVEETREVKVFFLGLFDCVSSVAVLETIPPKPVTVIGTADYVRHAVAVDEFRVKFKPALIA